MYDYDDVYDPYAQDDYDADDYLTADYYYPRWQEEEDEDEPTWTLWRITLLAIAILIVLSFIGYELLPFIQISTNTAPPPPVMTPIPRV